MMPNKALQEWGMSEVDFLTMLFRYGHFFSPEALAVTLVEEVDLPLLTLADDVVKGAIISYQRMFAPKLDEFTARPMAFGGFERPSIADGEVGEGTVMLLTEPRCGMPDFRHPGAAGEQANWPDSCRADITTSYRMTLPGLSDIQLKTTWERADQNWADVIDVKFRLDLAAYPNTRIWAFAANLGGSVLADQYLAQNNCAVRLQGRVSTRQWTVPLLLATLCHEHGHALGLNHSNGPEDLMFPSIHQAGMNRGGKPNDNDIRNAVALGYRRRTTPPVPPIPPGPSDTINLRIPAGLVAGKTYRLTPEVSV